MRIVIHDYIAYPFVVQLGRELARRGHEVLFLYGGGVRPPRGETTGDAEEPNLQIESVALREKLRSRAGPRRLLQERRYARRLGERIGQFDPDVVLSTQSSLEGQAEALKSAHAQGAGFVYWLQDVYSEAVGRLVARRIPLAGRLVARRFANLEGRLLREADAVVAISEDFRPILDRWRVAPERIAVQPNWAPLDEIAPGPKDNDWSRSQGLVDGPVLLYTGTLGRKHDPGMLVALAEGLPEATVVVVAEGTGVASLRDEAARLANLRLLPLQPPGRVAEVLASADVLVALLEPDAGVFSVPSKVLTYLTAGRPILAAIPGDNQASRTIGEAGAGIVVEPGDRAGFVRAARRLLDGDFPDAGRSGRAWAEAHFGIAPIADRIESVLSQAAQRGHSHCD